MLRLIYCCLLCLFCSSTLQAFPKQLSYQEFVTQIKSFHPLIKLTDIAIKKSDASLLAAQGNIDPVIEYDAQRKSLAGTEYYTYQNAEIKYPTPYAATIKSGIDYANGINANSELTIGNQSYLGIEMPLLKDLMIDKRRAAIQQAKIFQSQTAIEQKNAINNILFDASIAYAQWATSYKLQQLFEEYLTTAKNRLNLVKIAYVHGDRALMDTIEAYTQVQTVSLLLQDAQLKWSQSQIILSQFLWTKENIAYQISNEYIPDTTIIEIIELEKNLNSRIQNSIVNHPLLQIGDKKIASLEVEKKLKKQNLLPSLNIGANLLSKGNAIINNWSSNYLINNNKLNVIFKMPILFREGRGNYNLTKLKIQEINTQQNNKQWEIETKMRYYFTEQNNLVSQLNTNKNMLNNFSLLLKKEELKFTQGESSLFLINSRENKVIETKQKQVDLMFKLAKAKYSLIWSAGEFY